MPASEEDKKGSAAQAGPNAKMDAGQESDAVKSAGRDQKTGFGPTRDITLSTFVHLLGLPTANQVSVLESQIDVLTAKIGALGTKLDRILGDLEAVRNDAAVDRIDFQMTEIRSLLRRLVPSAAASGEIDTKHLAPKLQSAKAKVISSEPANVKPETKIIQKDNLEAEHAASDEEGYQQSEARRIRTQTKDGA